MQTTPLALFDFDGTLRKGDSIVEYLRLARKQKAMNAKEALQCARAFLLFRLGIKNEQALKTEVLRFRMRMTPAQRDALDKSFAERILLPKIYPDAVQEVRACRDAGMTVLLVSASTDHYMRYVASTLPVDAVLCTEMQSDGQAGPNCKGEEKVRRVQEYLSQRGLVPDWTASRAYGDSKGDIPMLSLCASPVLVNPKRRLRHAFPDAPRKKWR